jgi:hypothetical protein
MGVQACSEVFKPAITQQHNLSALYNYLVGIRELLARLPRSAESADLRRM